MRAIEIPAKTMSSATDGEKDLKKQIGCMNGFLQLFDRHHFITARRVSSRSHSRKRMLQGAERPKGPQAMEKGSETLKEKPRMSTESSRASCSSSTCSTSTFSSVDCNKTAQPETVTRRKINIPESPLQATAPKVQQSSSTKSIPSLDLRDIVKDSMHREARSLAIKHLVTDEKRGTVMKHIDSPRPLQQLKPGRPKTTGSHQVLVKEHSHPKISKEERPILHRFSYDGRDSQETTKWGLKQREFPRLSLDSKSTSLKRSACESRLDFHGQGQQMESESSSQAFRSIQESGSHHRSSSIVAKLMGLETLQLTNSPDDSTVQELSSWPKETSLSASTAEKSMQNHDTYSPHHQRNNPVISSLGVHNGSYVRKASTCSKLPVERAPWRQQDHGQGSARMASPSRKVATSTSQLSSSVYCEIEKRITELEFKQSDKDLRALKQILSAMEKTRERLENRRGESSEVKLLGSCSLDEGCSAHNSRLSMWENAQSYHQVLSVKGPGMTIQSGASDLTMKPDKPMDKVNLSTQAPTTEMPQLQKLQTRAPVHNREISVQKKKAKDITPKINNVKDTSRNLPSPHKKTTWGSSELNRIESCINSCRSFGMTSPRLRQNTLNIEVQSYPSISSPDSHGLKKQCSKKLTEKSSQNRKQRGRIKELQLNDDHLSEISSETISSSYQGDIASVKSESNSGQLSQRETEIISLPNTTNVKARQKEKPASTRRKNITAAENATNLLEQPSPISVLDDTFYNEDSPSPIKKTSTDFRDESSRHGEAERELKNSKPSTTYRRFDHNCKYNQKPENMKHSVRQLNFMHTEPDKIVASDNTSENGSCNSNHRYITKILLSSGILKESNIFSTTNQSFPSCHLINPDIFHFLEQSEYIVDLKEVTGKDDNMQLNKKLQRRIIFDIVNEVLLRKILSGRFTMENKSVSPQALFKEVYLEMDRLCRISDCSFHNATETTGLMAADILYPCEDWADYQSEFPGLVLDIERRIFKDLIDEVITGEFRSICDLPKRHCRKLFS